MKRPILPLAACAVALFAPGCKGRPPIQPSVATVNGAEVSLEAFQRLLRESAANGMPAGEEALKNEVLQNAADRELLMQAAVSEGIEAQPAISAQIQMELDYAEHRVRQDVLVNTLLRVKVQANKNTLQTTAVEVQGFYQLNQGLPFGNPTAPVWRGPQAREAMIARQVLYDERTRKVRSYEQAAGSIAQAIGYLKQQQFIQSYLRTLRDKAKIDVHADVLARAHVSDAPASPQGAGLGMGGSSLRASGMSAPGLGGPGTAVGSGRQQAKVGGAPSGGMSVPPPSRKP